MVKKIAIAIWILTASFLGILVVNYVGNKKMIENYGQGVYQQNELGFLGFTQPYINHFNKGNVFYQLGDYQKAKQEYQLALNLRPDEPYDCKIRVNYALSYVTPIDVDDINEDNYKDVIEICETAKSILAENDCATENNDGHYYAAQKLYNEINQFIEDLKNQYENPPTPTPTATPTPNPENGTATPTPSPKPDADATETPTPTPQGQDQSPTPTPQGGEQSPTPTPQGGEETPTPTPGGGEDTPTPTPGDGTPTPTPGGEGETPTPTPGGEGETPTPTPGGEGTGTPTPTPGGEGTGTPTPTPGGGEGQGTPTPTPGGEGQGTPTPTPGGGQGQGTPTPTPSPEDRIRDIQDRSNRERYGGTGDYNDDYNFGNSASW